MSDFDDKAMAAYYNQASKGVHPLGSGNSPFYDDPSDIGARIRNDALYSIESGEPYITKYMLPYVEGEAVARIKARTGFALDVEPDKRKEPELWRQRWVNEASHLERHLNGDDPIGAAAVRVLLVASRLRGAMEDKGDPEKIAALSILLVCELMEGGYMLQFAHVEKEAKRLEKTRTETYRKSIGAEAEDHEAARKACVHFAAKIWEENPARRIGDVAEELNGRILNNLEKFPAFDHPPKPDTIRGWLKDAAKAGELTIPDAAQKRGRPSKAKTNMDTVA